MSKKRNRCDIDQESENQIIEIVNNIYEKKVTNTLPWKNFRFSTHGDCIPIQHIFFDCMDKMDPENVLHDPTLRFEKNMKRYLQDLNDYVEYATLEEKEEFLYYYKQFEDRIRCLIFSQILYTDIVKKEEGLKKNESATNFGSHVC
jgi:hypothetical protein